MRFQPTFEPNPELRERRVVTQHVRTARVLALVTAAVAVVVGAWTVADPGLLHGPAAMQGSARGTALVLVLVAVPVLVISVWRAGQGSGVALLTWGGALLYVVYNAVLLLFLTPFNSAFLGYVAMLGCALWSTGYLLTLRELWLVGQSLATGPRVRLVAAYLGVVVVLNGAAWLARVVPALDDPYPTPMLAGTGVATNVIYVQDLAVWLPLAAVAAVWLARRRATGVVVVGALLAMWVIEAISVAVDQWWGATADPASTVVSKGLVLPFLLIALVGVVPLVALVRPAGRDRAEHRAGPTRGTRATEEAAQGG
ncbi:hypothetical protein [Pedococcus bigeumensis]|jgi:hypothetical protein|uniref:hypothetical protein n=1 Tax=Pedococcus bigeumensis TaxID=433644 RepID=UPI002FEA4706